jgi:hypothetical protein
MKEASLKWDIWHDGIIEMWVIIDTELVVHQPQIQACLQC